jgi:plastocyanin
MFVYRMCLIGAVVMLGACSTMPSQHPAQAASAMPISAPAPTTVAAPAPAPTPAPMAEPATAPMVMAEPEAAPMAPAAAAPAPVPELHRMAPKAPAMKKVDVAATAAPASASASVQISGHVDLGAASGQQVAAGEQADTLVYFVPSNGGARAKAGHYTVYTHNRDFNPEAIAVPQGSTVTFVNLDEVRHNVFSVTPGSAFDLGYQGSGEKAAHVFGRAGIVLVSCNVHHSMELDMLVVPTPYVSKVAADGSFILRGLPAGAGTLHFWNPRAQPASQSVTLPMSGAVRQQLLAIKPRMTTELNAGATP